MEEKASSTFEEFEEEVMNRFEAVPWGMLTSTCNSKPKRLEQCIKKMAERTKC